MKSNIEKVQNFLNAEIFTQGWMKRQQKLLILIGVLIFIHIFMGFQAQRQYHKLTELQKDLQDAQYQQLTIHSNFTNVTKQSAIAYELRERGSKIKESTKPAIRVK